MPDPTVTQLLEELETTLAAAEEIRYRIADALRTPPAQPQAAAAAPPPAAPVPPTPRPAAQPLDTTGLVRTGRGLFAWCREHGYLDQVVDLGRHAALPARVVDWSAEQIDETIDALGHLLAGDGTPTTPPPPAPAKPAAQRGKARSSRDYDVDPSGIPY